MRGSIVGLKGGTGSPKDIEREWNKALGAYKARGHHFAVLSPLHRGGCAPVPRGA